MKVLFISLLLLQLSVMVTSYRRCNVRRHDNNDTSTEGEVTKPTPSPATPTVVIITPGKLSTIAITNKPTTADVTNKPTTADVTHKPTTADVTYDPPTVTVSVPNTGRRGRCRARNSQTTAWPPKVTAMVTPGKKSTIGVTVAVTNKPTTADVTNKPTTADVTNKPTTADVTNKPTTADVTNKPTTADVTNKPTTADVTRKPTTADDVTYDPPTVTVSVPNTGRRGRCRARNTQTTASPPKVTWLPPKTNEWGQTTRKTTPTVVDTTTAVKTTSTTTTEPTTTTPEPTTTAPEATTTAPELTTTAAELTTTPPYVSTTPDYGYRWPYGKFSLMMAGGSCPDGGVFEEGRRYHDLESKNKWPKGTPGMSGKMNKKSYELIYCTKTNEGSGSDTQWPKGRYCVHRYDGVCPKGFKEGFLRLDDDNQKNKNWVKGTMPDGQYDENTKYYYCCRGDGKTKTAIDLPYSKPFYMYAHKQAKCQTIRGMKSKKQKLKFDLENKKPSNKASGSYPKVIDDGDILLHLCLYQSDGTLP